MSSKYPSDAILQENMLLKFRQDSAERYVYKEIFPDMRVNACHFFWYDMIHQDVLDVNGNPTGAKQIEHRDLISAKDTAVACYSNIRETEESSWTKAYADLEFFAEQIPLTECCISSCEPLPTNIDTFKLEFIYARTENTLNERAIALAFDPAIFNPALLPTWAAVNTSMLINSPQGAVIDGQAFLDDPLADIPGKFLLLNMNCYTTGARNKLVIDQIGAFKLQRHPSVINALQAGCVVPGTATIDQVAQVLGFEKIVVVSSVTNSAIIGQPANLQWMVQKKMLLVATKGRLAQTEKQVNFGFTAYKTGYKAKILTIEEKVNVGSDNPFGVDYFALYHDYSPKVQMVEAGTLITNTYA